MKRKTRTGLWLIFTAILVLFCRCATTPAPDQTTADGVTLTQCYNYATSDIPVRGGVQCSYYFDCPTRELSTTKLMISPSDGTQFSDLTMAQLREQACRFYDEFTLQPAPPSPSTNSEESSAPIVPAVVEPAPSEPPVETAPLSPYLTGDVTACDNVARYVNFTIADPTVPYDPATIKVHFNQQEVTCTRSASASDVLTCLYPPAPYGPPASIEVFIGEERVNEFNFDGGPACDPVPQQPNNNGNNSTDSNSGTNNPAEVPPVAPNPTCDPHLDPACPLDCTIPANADLCG